MTRHCICCDCVVKCEPEGNNPLVVGPVYDGLIFRATGNFGSRIFDPMPIGIQEFLEISVCDDCIEDKAEKVVWLHNIDTVTTAESSPFSEREK